MPHIESSERGPSLPRTLAWLLTLGAAALLALVWTARVGHAQTPAPAPDGALPRPAARRAGAGYLTIGGVGMPLGTLDARLRAGGLPGVTSGAATFGSGAYAVVGRALLGASGHALAASRTERDGWATRVRGGYGLLDVGVTAIATSRSLVAVLAGAGASRITTKVRPLAGGGFDSTVGAPGRALELSSHTALLHVGLMADHALRRSRGGTMLVGVRAGYVGRTGGSRWTADEASLSDGPAVAPGGAYVRLTLGAPLGRPRDAALPALGSLLPWVVR
jgi:hypothetical protein